MAELSLKHLVLGLLLEQDGYGYELQQRLDRRCPSFGFCGTSIYRVLDRLKAGGYIRGRDPTVVVTRRQAARVRYEITAAGREEFGRWMIGVCAPPVVRDGLHARLLLAQPGDLPRLLAAAEAQQAERRLALLWTRDPQVESAPPGWPRAAVELVAGAHVQLLETAMRVCDEVLDEVREWTGPQRGR